MRKAFTLFVCIALLSSCKDERAKRLGTCIKTFTSEMGKEKAKAFCECYHSKLATKYDVKDWDKPSTQTAETGQWVIDCKKQALGN